MWTILVPGFLIALFVGPSNCWGEKKVKLKDVEVLTLYQGKYTTGRRSSPVPQLQCLGGSAGCYDAPSVVQCYNKGSDGQDVQWECKADMKTSQKFGSIEVTCEGYDYADDSYILAGSCGLEYRLERTGRDGGSMYTSSKTYGKSGSTFQNLLFLGGAAFVIYVIYQSCLAPGHRDADATAGHDSPPPYDGPGHQGRGFFGGGGGGGGAYPPPPGFRPTYHTDASCGPAGGLGGGLGGSGGGGFWTGALAGGTLGYLFGNRNSGGYRPAYGYPSEGSYASTSSYSSGGSSSAGDTHTSSGFGGTRRR